MAERRCIIERGEGFFDVEKLIPSPKLARHLAEIGADTWVPNPRKGAQFPVMPMQKTRSKKEQITPDLYPVWVSTSLGPYGLFAEVTDQRVSARIAKLQWHKFATAIFEKSRIAITGFGTPLVNKEDILVPLYLEGEEAGPCRVLLKLPLVEASVQFPYDSLIDRAWTTIAHTRFRQGKTTIPVPHVYYFYLEGVDILGANCPWILQERLPGTPLHHEISSLSASQIQRVGHQWGYQLAFNHSLRFSSPGALRTTSKGERVAIQTVGSDPEGRHLTADHYSSPNRAANGAVFKPHQKPTTAVEYFFSLASTSLIRLMSGFGDEFADTPPEEREGFLWGCIAYIYLRHLHLFVPQYATSDLVENYFVLDLPNLDIGNIHVDTGGSICGITSCDGMNIIPAHLTLRLPNVHQGPTKYADDQAQVGHRDHQRYRFLRESIARGFWSELPKFTALKPGKTLKGSDLNDVWAIGSKAKSFERLLYRFTGNNEEDSPEFRAYLVYARETWDSLFKASSTGYSNTLHLTQFIKNNWIVLTTCYPQLCFNPPLPKISVPGMPATSQQSPCRSNSKSKVRRLRKVNSEGVKPTTSSFKLDSSNTLAHYFSGFTGFVKMPFSAIGERFKKGARASL